MRLAITQLDDTEKANIRGAVAMCVRYWPNADLGETSPREHIRSAFQRIRRHVVNNRGDLITAICDLERDAAAHEDM